MSGPTKPRLTYMPGRGVGELSRLAFVASGIEFEDIHLQSKEEYEQMKTDGRLLFKQVPVLEVEGQAIVGSDPIVTFIARKGNLYGNSLEEKTRIDVLAMGAKDCRYPFLSFAFMNSPESQDQTLLQALKKAKERYLPVFEKILSESTSGYLVGTSLTIADLSLFDTLTHISDNPKISATLGDFPRCQAFIKMIADLPRLRAYLSSPQRSPIPDVPYANRCKEILSL